jgi:enoyl-CoA hydratase/carnithine racemase
MVFEERATPSGHRIGFAQLNAERTLNSLTLEMVRLLDAQLRQWAEEPRVAVVVLSGAGIRALCAGANIRFLYEHQFRDAQSFFAEEYRLDYRIHHFPKPVLVWGSGIVMGGGIGLMAGASHRVVTETSRLAMPETTIGLFPDVGASYFLGRIPRAQGHFIGMTGAVLNAQDALMTGLATHFVAAGDREILWQRLKSARWHDDASANRTALDALLVPITAAAQTLRPASMLLEHRALIERLMAADFRDSYRKITALVTDDPWLAAAVATLRAGCPTSAALSWELLHRMSGRSLGDVLRAELTVAIRCCEQRDFSEGVRALLIDKDNQPSWSPATIDDVTPEWLARFFAEPQWPSGGHPLADLD